MSKSNALPVPERVIVVMKMLRRAVDDRLPCPSNSQLAARIGCQTPAAGANIVSLLETMNLIRVQRGNHSRIVTILETGKSTAGEIDKGRVRQTREQQPPSDPKSEVIDCDHNPFWTPERDALLMDLIADDADFHQAAAVIGTASEQAAARFDALSLSLGWLGQ